MIFTNFVEFKKNYILLKVITVSFYWFESKKKLDISFLCVYATIMEEIQL